MLKSKSLMAVIFYYSILSWLQLVAAWIHRGRTYPSTFSSSFVPLPDSSFSCVLFCCSLVTSDVCYYCPPLLSLSGEYRNAVRGPFFCCLFLWGPVDGSDPLQTQMDVGLLWICIDSQRFSKLRTATWLGSRLIGINQRRKYLKLIALELVGSSLVANNLNFDDLIWEVSLFKVFVPL